MKTITQSCVMLIVALSLLASCGGGDSGGAPVCTPTGNMSLLHSTSTGTAPLTGLIISVAQGAGVHTFPVFVRYTSPPVAVIAAGYAPGAVDPRTFGMDIAQAGQSTDNPLEFSLTFDRTMALGTYDATWRFVATDLGRNEVFGCQDLPVTYTTFTM